MIAIAASTQKTSTGADGKQQCSSGMTALHDAAYKCQIGCYELLVSSGACDLNQKDHLKYKAEQLLNQTTGTNRNGGPMSYGESTVAAASIVEGGGEGGFDLNSVTSGAADGEDGEGEREGAEGEEEEEQ